ncbi:MAG: efflux RND transporter periplasmic adaptor subunit [Siculibacillus sp.]|nr:efflux RND transporter periplasmic adaptor subunit [Siculibacillus sp.]
MTAETPATAGPSGAAADAWQRLRGAVGAEEHARAWLALLAEFLGGFRVGVVVVRTPGADAFESLAVHPPDAEIGADLSIVCEAALAEGRGVTRRRAAGEAGPGFLALAYPIVVDDAVQAVVACDCAAREPAEIPDLARRLQWGAAWIEALVRRRSLLPSRRLIEVMDLTARLLEAADTRLGLNALALELRRLLEADWVGLAVAEGDRIDEVAALSHGFVAAQGAPLLTALRTAMQECLDQGEDILVPPPPAAVPLVRRAHLAVLEAVEARQVVSVPVAVDGAVAAVISVGGRGALSAEQIEFLRLFATLVGPALRLKRRDDRSLLAHAGEVARTGLARVFGSGHVGTKLGLLAGLAVVGVLVSASAPLRVAGPATLEGSVHRVVTAPIAGFVARAEVRAGDTVKAGDLLARLDDRELQIEKARWRAERDKYQREHQRALAESERTRTQVLRAQIDQAQARLDLIEEQLARIEVRAPFDGLVVKGDLSRALGAPVQRGDVLFEVAPLDDYRIAARIDERDVALIEPGQTGTLVLSSFPDRPLALRVARVSPVAQNEDGRNLFRVEGDLAASIPGLRPGMQGIVKIETGDRPVSDVLLHRVRPWLRTTLWRWSP